MVDHEPKAINTKDLGAIEGIGQIQIEIPRDNRGRIRWAILGQNPEFRSAIIESEAKRLINQGVLLSHKGLIGAKFSALSRAIVAYYPDGYYGLRQKLNLPTGPKPKNYWTKPGRDKEMLQEAQAVYVSEGEITTTILVSNGHSDFVQAISKHYPGGWPKLRNDLGAKALFKPDGYWTDETIKSEATAFYQEHNGLSATKLEKAGRSDLRSAARRYPGGLRALKKELAIEQTKPHGYWVPKTIRTEAEEFYGQFGSLSQTVLMENNRWDLLDAVRDRYPGGIRQLEEDLATERRTRKAPGYWTTETIKQEAVAFFEQYGALTTSLLEKTERFNLMNAIRAYPGDLRQLQKDIGAEAQKRPNGYWTPENTEKETLAFTQTYGFLSTTLMRKYRYFRLMNAAQHYPGGLKALREKLGISKIINIEVPVSTKDADEALGRLIR